MIRPFRFGDVVLIQRLGRQAATLNTIQALLQPQSAVWAALTALLPWNDAKITTHVLRQQGHGLVGLGFLQAQKRPGRPELEVMRLAPGLDARLGHPVIWEKLLAHQNALAAQQNIARIYVDAPDQPLPVHTLSHVGFRSYARETIWRLNHPATAAHPVHGEVRSRTKGDEWALQELYRRTVPEDVRLAEGMHSEQALRPPILDWWGPGALTSLVLEQRGDVRGAVQVVQGQAGVWLQLWADLDDPTTQVAHQLIRAGLRTLPSQVVTPPVYVGVREYHGGLGAILGEYGFAPFTDRVRLVRPVMQWVREPAFANAPAVEHAARGVVTAPYTWPQASLRAPRGPSTRRPPALKRAWVKEIG